MEKAIPKIIHYCWFGGANLPELAQKCIESWKKKCPEYQIIEWNESNFDLNACTYVREAYDEKKWAFVSDYVRFWVLYHYGGVYIDTDVEIVKSIDEIVRQGAYMGCEPALTGMNNNRILSNMKVLVNPGLGMAAPIHHFFIKEILDIFESRSFYKESGETDLTTIVETTTGALIKYGYDDSNSIQKVAGMTLYPIEYFCPKNYFTGELKLTQNTFSIHHYTATWQDDRNRAQFEVLQKLNLMFGKKIGYKMWRLYTFPSRVKNKLHLLGIKGTIKFMITKIGKVRN